MGSEQNRQHCNSKCRKWQHPNPGHQVLFTLFHQPTLSFKSTIFSKLPKIVITLYSELHRHKVLSWKLSLEEEAFPLIPDNHVRRMGIDMMMTSIDFGPKVLLRRSSLPCVLWCSVYIQFTPVSLIVKPFEWFDYLCNEKNIPGVVIFVATDIV